MTVALKKKAEALAAKLTPDECIDLADLLYASVPAAYQRRIDEGWEEEIDRRLDEYEAGKVKAIPSRKVHAAVRRRLNEIKTRGLSSRRAA
jgi:putative addiction module component (TIGR02574 family)